MGEAGSAALSHSNITLPPTKGRAVYWKKPEQSEENLLLFFFPKPNKFWFCLIICIKCAKEQSDSSGKGGLRHIPETTSAES